MVLAYEMCIVDLDGPLVDFVMAVDLPVEILLWIHEVQSVFNPECCAVAIECRHVTRDCEYFNWRAVQIVLSMYLIKTYLST